MKNTALALVAGMLLFSCKKDTKPAPEPSPTVTAINPATGPKNTVVTITGTNFGTNAAMLKVFFNGVQGTIQAAAATSITALVPADASTGEVKVEKNGVQVSGPVFTFLHSGTVTTFAGSSQGYSNGTGTAAQFNAPTGVVRDAAGNFYVADRDNHRIRKISAAGVVTTFAGSSAGFTNGTAGEAKFNQPYGLAIDASGNLYVGDRMNYSIRKITSAGVVSTLAGDGVAGFENGTGSAARFNEALGLACDASGNVFVADYLNNVIRKITPAGVVTTFAGSGSAGTGDGTGTAASFYGPFGITIDANGNFFVGDYRNHLIRKITAAGVVTTLAGSGNPGVDDGTGAAASFYQPAGLVTDGNGNVYVCDALNNTIRKVTAAGVVTTFAGSYNAGDTDGTVANARFSTPLGITADVEGGILYIADFYNHRIRKLIIE